jgi:two-component system response regulator PhoP
MRILVIEDEAAVREALQRQLIQSGFTVDVASDGEEGLFAAIEHPLDAAIVDLGLPKLPGIELIRQLRTKQSNLPVLVLTARVDWRDTVEALRVGADDYVRKPFEFEEVLARVQAIMRRNGGWASSELVCEPIALHIQTQAVRVHGAAIELTTFEYRVLEYLMLHAGQIVSKTELRERLYEDDSERDYNVVDVIVARLRRKLDPEDTIEPIQTVRGRGYRFRLGRGGT